MPPTITDRQNGLTASSAVKVPVRVATTAAVTLSGYPTIDGVVPEDGDRVLVKDHGTALSNGIYIVGPGDWRRASDCDGLFDLVGGCQVFVIDGSDNLETYWRVAGRGAVVPDVDDIIFEPITGPVTFASDIASAGNDKGAGIVGFSQSSTYDAGTLGAALQSYVGVKDRPYLAVGDNAADDTAAIQAAITANYGGTLFFPDGDYRVSGEITIAQPIKLVGLGARIITTSATANIFKITAAASNPGVEIEGIRFDATVTRTAGAYVSDTSANGAKVRRCRLDNAWIGVDDSGSATEGLEVTDCYFYATRSVCIGLSAQTSTQGSVYTIIENNTFVGTSEAVQTPIAIQITSCGDCVIRGNTSLFCMTAVAVVPTTGQVVQLLTIETNTFDSGTGNGVAFSPTGGIIRSAKVRDNWLATFDGDAVLASGTGSIELLEIMENSIGNNGGNGINLATLILAEADIQKNKIGGNGGNGVNVIAALKKFKIMANTIGETGQWLGNTGWDVLINAGASDDYFVTENFVSGTGSGGVSDGGSGVNKHVDRNLVA